MLTYILQQKNQDLLVNLKGPVDERSSSVLTELLARVPAGRVILDMKGVEYFNSLGIRAWANFITSLVRGRTVFYENCPADFINQINMMPLLTQDASILSFTSEFICPKCNHTQSENFDAGKSKKQLLAEFDQKVCSHCRSQLLPDEDPETFLYFKNP